MTRGFSILEVLIAFAIVSTMLVAVVLLVLGIPHVLSNTQMHSIASNRASAGFSREMARGLNGFESIVTRSHTLEGSYLSSLTVQELGEGAAKQMKSKVSWNSWTGAPRTMLVTGIATDYKNASAYACSPFLFGRLNDQIMLEIGADTSPSLPLLSAVAASRTRLVATTDRPHSSDSPALFVFNTSNNQIPQSPSITFDTSTSTDTGYVAVAIAGEHVYAITSHDCTERSRCAQLEILSLANDLATLVSIFSLPPSRTIAYRNGRVYVGALTSLTEPEFLIIDVSNPASPTQIGSANIGVNVNDILISGNIAYVATADNSQSGAKALMAFEIDSPKEGMIVHASAWQGGGARTQRLAHSGSSLYLGRSFFNAKELYEVNTSSLATPVASIDFDSGVFGLVALGQRLMVLTENTVEFLEIATDSNDLSTSYSITLPHKSVGVDLVCGGSRVYVASNSMLRGHLSMLSGDSI